MLNGMRKGELFVYVVLKNLRRAKEVNTEEVGYGEGGS
jgi:hypothetical protein